MKKINMKKLQNRMGKTIGTKEALQSVTPMQWNDDVLTGKKKATVRKAVK